MPSEPDRAGREVGSGESLFDPIFSTDELLAATGPTAWVQAMLDVEAALAGAEAELGLVPTQAAAAIAGCCQAAQFDPASLGRTARLGGNLAIALVEAMRAALPDDVAEWVHWGATSQDVVDTALMVVTRRAITLIEDELARLTDGCAGLAARYRRTIMPGRTLLQQALPITFGYKAAGWLVTALDARARLGDVVPRLAVQLGGAAGTLASLGDDGPEVASRLSRRLDLSDPVLPWHTNRVRVAEVASALGIVAGVAAKISLDVGLLMQTEIGEVLEPEAPGRGSSSTLPHKRNPVGAATANAAARRAHGLVGIVLGGMVQEHERALGGWQAEWDTMTELLRVAGGAAATAADTVTGLEVRSDRMADNLDATAGAIMTERITRALAPSMGLAKARSLVVEAARRATSSRSFGEELLKEPAVAEAVTEAEVDDLLDPAGYLGSCETFVERALEAHRTLGGSGG